MTGFFERPLEEIEDLTVIPGDETLLKRTVTKSYTCNDCKKCSHATKELSTLDDEGKEKKIRVSVGGNPSIHIQGEGKKKILIVVDEATSENIKSDSPIIGQNRKLLKSLLSENNISLEKDCWVVNAVRGFKSGTKAELGIASKSCRNVLIKDINQLNPSVIIPFGFRAIHTLLGGHGPSINKDWEKFVAVDETAIPDQILKSWVIPALSIREMIEDLKVRKKIIKGYADKSQQTKGYISKNHKKALDSSIPLATNEALYSDELKIRLNWLKRSIRTINKYINTPFVKDKTLDSIKRLFETNEILDRIAYYKTKKVLGTDIETNSLKPYRVGSKIFCIGFSDGKIASSWMMKDPIVIEATKELLTAKGIRFIIHNLAFEWKWFKRKLDIEVENIFVDSMIMQHAWDHRTGAAGLKYAVFTNFGVPDSLYDGKCKPFFNVCDEDKTGKYAKSDQVFNKFQGALDRGVDYNKGLLFPLNGSGKRVVAENKRRAKLVTKGYLTEDEQLTYVGMDADYCYRLVQVLRPKLGDKEREAIRFYVDGVIMSAHMTDNGMKINREQLLENIHGLETQVEKLHDEILLTPEAKLWETYIKEKIQNETDKKEIKKLENMAILNYSSPPQLSTLFFTVLGLKPQGKTASGNYSTTAAVVEKLNTEIGNLIIKRKKLIKSKDTYLMGWLREADDDDIVHPNFNLGQLTSHRSSSSAPNAQNSPKRNKEMKKLTRNFIIPHSPTQKLISGDYSGAETRCMASIAQDPQMKEYMTNPNSDMHRDSTIEVFKLENAEYPDTLLAELRGIIKNGFVFPEFYGDYYGNCAVNMWESLRHITKENQDWIEKHFMKVGLANIESFTEHVKECERLLWKVRFKKIDDWKAQGWDFYKKHGYIETVIGFKLRGRLNRKLTGNYTIQGPSFAVLLQGMIYMDREIKRLGLKSKMINQIHDDCITSVENEELEIMKKLYIENLVIKARNAPLFHDWMDIKFIVDVEIHDQDNLSWATKPTGVTIKEEDYINNYVAFS